MLLLATATPLLVVGNDKSGCVSGFVLLSLLEVNETMLTPRFICYFELEKRKSSLHIIGEIKLVDFKTGLLSTSKFQASKRLVSCAKNPK